MNTKQLRSKIRGWFPQEPNFAKLQKAEGPKFLTGRNNWGLKIVTALFWVFAVGGIMTIALQLSQYSYLPLNVRFIITTVSIMDCVGMIIVGAGLLTAKRRWIDAAIVFSILSIVMFYVVPMRVAFPLEVIAIAYLVYARKGLSGRGVAAKLPVVALVGLVCITLLTPLATVNAQVDSQLPAVQQTQVAHFDEVSADAKFVANLTVYKLADADPQKDYYKIITNVECVEGGNLNYVNASLSFTPSQATTITYSMTPHASPAYPTEVGLGVATLYLGNTKTVFVYSSSNSVDWVEKTVGPQGSEVFSVELWVPQDTHFSVNFMVSAGLDDRIFGNLWTDTLNMEGTAA